MVLPDNQTLYTALEELGLIDNDILQRLLQQCTTDNTALATVLVEKDLIGDQNLGKTMADIMSLPFINLSGTSIDIDILRLVPQVVAIKQKSIAFKKDEMGIHVAMADPSNIEFIELLKKKTSFPIVVYFATARDIREALYFYNKDVTKVFDTIISENIKEAQGLTEDDPPIIKIVDSILNYAYENKASDIHLEPQ